MKLIHQRCLHMVIMPLCLLGLMRLPQFVKGTTNDSLSNQSTTLPFISLITHHQYYQTLYNPLYDINQLGWILLDTMTRLWLGVECLFYLYYVVTHTRFQPLRKSLRPLTKQQRTQTYHQCFDAIEDVEVWSVGWFYIKHDMSHPSFDQIRRGNIEIWLCWAYWDDDVEQVVATEDGAKQLEWMVKTLEDKYNITFPAGCNDEIRCIRMTMDPVQAVHRPFLFYLTVYSIVSVLNSLVLTWWWKFQPYGDHDTLWGGPILKLHQAINWLKTCWAGQKQHQRKQQTTMDATSLLSETVTLPTPKQPNDGSEDQIVYWYRPATTPYQRPSQQNAPRQNDGNTRTPLVFLHGFGIGPGFYMEFIYHLVKMNRPLYVVEIPSVAMRMVETVPEVHVVVNGIRNMLHSHGYKHAVFVGHSFGTDVTNWIMNCSPSMIAGLVMIDPVCFLLQHAHVAFNFIYKTPKRLFEYVMRYGASRELYISNYVTRHFQWYENLCFVDKRYGKQHPLFHNTIVFLSERDGVTDTPLVAKNFAKHGVNHRIMQRLEHGEFLMNWTWRKQILDQVDWIARNVDDEGIDIRP